MAITFIGSGSVTNFTTSTVTYNFSSLLDASGLTPTLQPNDIVIVCVGHAGTGIRTTAQLTPTGYTAIGAAITRTATAAASLLPNYKIMGATPDTSVAIPAASSATTASVAATIHVFRGVDTTTPIDVTTTTAIATATPPNPPSITPATAGAWIMAIGLEAMATGTALQATAPTGLSSGTNAWQQVLAATNSSDAAIGTGYKSDWTSGAFDCPAYTGGNTTTGSGSAACAVVLRPAIAAASLPPVPNFNAMTPLLAM